MGAAFIAETASGESPDEALTAWLAGPDWNPDWEDPHCKGYKQVWDKPVTDDAIDWMRGWIGQNPPEGVDPWDKWGPWLMFPLASGGWHFFGLVNT